MNSAKHLKQWSTDDVEDWLDSLGLSKHSEAFSKSFVTLESKDIDGRSLKEIDDDYLRFALNITSNLIRRKILKGTNYSNV